MRRFFSIIFYIFAGWGLMSVAMAAAIGADDILVFLVIFGIFLFLSLFWLILGLLVSKGNRRQEAGTVLLASAAMAAFTYGSVVFMLVMPDTRALFSAALPEIKANPWGPVLPLIAMGLGGWWLWRTGVEREGTSADGAG